MSSPITHHHALGIHPGAFVQPTAPNTADVQDGVLWIDTSAGPPYQLKRWDAGAAVWHPVQMDATGYPLPGGHRLDIATQITPVRVLSLAGEGRAFLLGSAPADWQSLAYHDAAWDSVIQSTATGSGYVPDGAGSSWGSKIADTKWVTGSLTDGNQPSCTWLHRRAFILPSGVITSATLQIWGDNEIQGAWLNGSDLGYTLFLLNQFAARPDAFSVSPSLFVPGGSNVLALQIHSPNGPTSVDYELQVTVLGAPLVRLVHASGDVCWEHDGTAERIFSAGIEVLHTPLPTLTTPPTVFVGRDPATGLPAWCEATAPADVAPDDLVALDRDTGQLQRVPAPTTDADMHPRTVAWHQIKTKDYPGDHTDDWQPPETTTCDRLRCGAAFAVAETLYVRQTVLFGILTWYVIKKVPPAVDMWWYKLINTLVDLKAPQWVTSALALCVDAGFTNVGFLQSPLRVLTNAQIHAGLQAIDPGPGIPILAQLLYPHLRCLNNVVVFDPIGIFHWGQAIWSDEVDFTLVQRALLVAALTELDFMPLAYAAAAAGRGPRDDCGAWTGP